MEEMEEIKGLADYLLILGRRKKQFIIPAIMILLASAMLAFGLPSIYQSKATILIEQQEIPSDLVRSTVTSYAGERIQMISQRVMTTDNLSKIINSYDLYTVERKSTSMTMLVEEMREEINLEMISSDVVDPRSGRPTTATIAFTLSFNNENPRTSQKVTSELVSLFLNANLERRTKSAVETTGFLATESIKLEQRVAQLETSLAEFKGKNINNLPELKQLNIQLMESAERELKDVAQRVRVLDERKIYLTSELAQLSPNTEMVSADGTRILGPKDRLKVLQSEYVTMVSRYSATHPDLIRIKKEITALRKEVGITDQAAELRLQLKDLKTQMASMRDRYSFDHPDVKKAQRNMVEVQAALKKALKVRKQEEQDFDIQPDNPAYIQLRTQLKAAEGELRSLHVLRDELRQKRQDLEDRLIKSPQVEREYLDLARDYDNAMGKYKEVKAKQLEAELAEALERDNKGERFSLIEPPLLPEKPSKPNRLAILFLGFILSLAGGVGVVAVAEAMSDAISDASSLIRIIGESPLITIPYIEVEEERIKRLVVKRRVLVAVLIAGISSVAIFHFLIMPLDVLWYVIMRRLGVEY
ncbi:MAG: lipopolysaccharide biosynthesis protein [Gammaproteobacteria bacterium]|nr:lipopolysaccharide biosynthesis protein [Gammaproteobacteria bacterium]